MSRLKIYYQFKGEENVLELMNALLTDLEETRRSESNDGFFLLIHSSITVRVRTIGSGAHSIKYESKQHTKEKSSSLIDKREFKLGKDNRWRGLNLTLKDKDFIELNEENIMYWVERINKQKR